ncbi:MAG TPA: hypothetical protein VFA75_00325 [Nevskia sp.]|nr:hypothetical protein [Nevskia sp.]
MLKTISQYMRGGDKVMFTLSRDGADGVRLLITPGLAPEPDNADERTRQIRAMLARPILIRSTLDALETEGLAALEQAASVRNEIAASYESLMTDLRGQAKAAAGLAAAKNGGKGGGKAAAKPPAPAPAADAEEDEESQERAASGEAAAAKPAATPEPPPPAPAVDLFGG